MAEFTMKIAAFNVKNLGWSKVSDTTVVKYLVKVIQRWFYLWDARVCRSETEHVVLCSLQILSRYSVVVVLEVMDKNGEAMTQLLQELNR